MVFHKLCVIRRHGLNAFLQILDLSLESCSHNVFALADLGQVYVDELGDGLDDLKLFVCLEGVTISITMAEADGHRELGFVLDSWFDALPVLAFASKQSLAEVNVFCELSLSSSLGLW